MSEVPEPPLASLSLTHVYYNPADPLSLLSAWLALLPQALIISYVTTLFITRELELLLMFAGQLSCEGLNWALKRLIREQRPKTMHGRGYGMPSSHAQFVSFFAVYLGLLLARRGLGGKELVWWRRASYTLIAMVGSGVVASSRIYLSYHTEKQVFVGYAVGVVFAVGWYVATAFARGTSLGKEGVLAKITGGRTLWETLLWVGEPVWVRDRICGADLVEDGWKAAQKDVRKTE